MLTWRVFPAPTSPASFSRARLTRPIVFRGLGIEKVASLTANLSGSTLPEDTADTADVLAFALPVEAVFARFQ